jgi:glutaredoxin-like YruB-family protein
MAKSVKVYSATWCPWCYKVKDFLKANKILFQEIDVEKVPGAAEELTKKTGQTGIPVIDIDGEMIIGFNEPALRKALGI